MNICILNSVHPISDTRVLRVAETLAEAGNYITIIAPIYSVEDSNRFEVDANITHIGIKRKPKGHFEAGRSFFGIIETIFSRLFIDYALYKHGKKIGADVYHCNEMDSWVIGIVLKYICSARVIFDVHEYYPAISAEMFSSFHLGRLFERIFRNVFIFLTKFTDGIIFVNHSLVELYKFKGKKVIVRNCVRKRDFQIIPVDTDLEVRYKKNLVVLHIGGMREHYGAQSLLKAMELIDIPEVLCLIVGGASDDFKKELEERCLEQRIEVIDMLPFPKMIQYLAIADIGIILIQPRDKSLFYSLGRKFLEYIAAGLPIVASNFPEMSQLIDKYNLGEVVDPEDPLDIANALVTLSEDAKLRNRLGENARRAFNMELNWELESQYLLDLYASWNK